MVTYQRRVTGMVAVRTQGPSVNKKNSEPVFSYDSVKDVLSLIAHEKWPDGQFSDNECVLWELITKELGFDVFRW